MELNEERHFWDGCGCVSFPLLAARILVKMFYQILWSMWRGG